MPHAIFVIGMVIFLFTFLTIVHRLEKRLVWPYSELQAQPYFDDPTGYGARWVSVAVQSGFTLLGWARDLKGETYRISYAMLVSPDRTTLAIIGVGALLKMPLQGTWMHTPSLDGRSFYSTDKQAGVQIDLSGNWRNQLAPEPGFVRLWQRHRAWIRDLAIAPRPFTEGRELEEFRALREQHYRAMERAGLITYTDASATQWQFTLLGAAKTATWSYFVGLIRAVTRGRFPRNA